MQANPLDIASRMSNTAEFTRNTEKARILGGVLIMSFDVNLNVLNELHMLTVS